MSSALSSFLRCTAFVWAVHCRDEQCTAFSFTVHCLKLAVHCLRMGSALPSLIRMHCLELVHCLRVVHCLLFYGCTASNCQYNIFMFFARQCKLHTTGSAKNGTRFRNSVREIFIFSSRTTKRKRKAGYPVRMGSIRS